MGTLFRMAGRVGIEPTTSWLTAKCYYHLSYRPILTRQLIIKKLLYFIFSL